MILTLCTAGLSAHRCAQWQFDVSQCVSAVGCPSPPPRVPRLPSPGFCPASAPAETVLCHPVMGLGCGTRFWPWTAGRAPLTRRPAVPAFAWRARWRVWAGRLRAVAPARRWKVVARRDARVGGPGCRPSAAAAAASMCWCLVWTGSARTRPDPANLLAPGRVCSAGAAVRFRQTGVHSVADAPLAQSAERLHGKEKVYGSIP